MTDSRGTRWEDAGIQASGNHLARQCVSLEQAARRSSESSPVTDTVLEDVLEESITQQVSSAFH